MYLTITTSAQGEYHLQDPFPAEGYCVKRIAPSTTATFEVTVIQLNHLKAQLDAAVKAGVVSSYTFDDTEQVPSDELLELRNRVAKVATLAVTGGAVPNLVTLGVRKGDIFNMYVAATGITLSYEVDEVNSATCFTATVVVVAFDKVAAGDKIYFSRAGVLITGTERIVAGGVTHVIATVSQSPYQRTSFGRFFVKAADGKPYFLTSAGAELSLGMTGSDPLVFKGAIALATDFPLLADVKVGWLYRVTTDVTDSGGGGRTGTTQSFLAGAEIAWNGTGGVTGWSELGTSSAVQEVHVAGAFVLPAGSSTTFVDTATVGAGTSCTLPPASATKLGETIAVGDYTNDAAAHNITIARTGGDTIDGVAADFIINKNNVFVALECVSATGWKTVARIAPVASAATPAAVGTAAAGTSKVCSPDDHVHGHGNLVGGAFHADAVAGAPGTSGFMTGADAACLDYEFGDYQVLTGAGAANLLVSVTELATAGAGDAITLAVGTVVGQEKIVRLASLTAPGHTSILTVTAGPGGPYTFSSAGDFIHLKWNGATWGLLNLFIYGVVGSVAAIGVNTAGTSPDVARIDHVHGTSMTAVGDLITANSIGPVVPGRIAAGAVGTALVGNGVNVKPSFQAIAGVALDVLDAVVAVADSLSGVATVLGSVQINDLAGAPIAHVVEGLLLAQTAIYVGRNGIQAHVTYGLATAGSILASGAGWCVFKTDATGLFACTMTNANDEGVYFSVCSVDGGTDALAAGAIIRGCIPDLATWIA